MGHYKDTTVQIKMGGKLYRVSKEVQESLEQSGKLDKPKQGKTSKRK